MARRAFPVLYARDVGAVAAVYGVEPGPGPRHELFVYVDEVDATVAALRAEGERVVREPVDMPWGERVAFVADPEGNLVSLAAAPAPG